MASGSPEICINSITCKLPLRTECIARACVDSIVRHEATFSIAAVRANSSAASFSRKAIFWPLIPLVFTCMTNSATSATMRSNVDARFPLSLHHGADLNHEEKSWIASPITPIATAANEQYPAISQRDKEMVSALRSSADATRRYARYEDITAWILGVSGTLLAVCLWKRQFWRR